MLLRAAANVWLRGRSLLSTRVERREKVLRLSHSRLPVSPRSIARVGNGTHKINVVSLDRENAHGNVLKVRHTVNTRLAVRTDDFVLAHSDPGIIVDLLRCEGFPRAFSFVRDHSVSSARKCPLTCAPLTGPVRSWFLPKHLLSVFSGAHTRALS